MIKNIILSIILAILVVFSCTKIMNYSWDITQNHANSISNTTKDLLNRCDSLVQITVYSPNLQTLTIYQNILELFKKNSPFVHFSTEHSIIEADLAAQLKVYSDHVIVINYKNAQHAIDIQHDKLAEQQLSSLLQQSINHSNNWIAFLTGHAEADPLNTEEYGLSAFADLFIKQGMHIATLNLAEQQFIPQNAALLIVANPQTDLVPKEKALLHQYVADGGKILWFTEPDAKITAFLAEEFGLKPSKGVIIDPESSNLGSPHPALKILTSYPQHAITNGIDSATIMPWSAHLQILYEANNWQQTPCITTKEQTWTYTGPATKDLEHLSKFKEHTGPLNIAIALTKTMPNKSDEQRALVFADSSFIINKYLPLYANTQLATNIVSWTQNSTEVFLYDTPPLKDFSYVPNQYDRILYQYIFTIICPLVLISVGYFVAKPTRRKVSFRK